MLEALGLKTPETLPKCRSVHTYMVELLINNIKMDLSVSATSKAQLPSVQLSTPPAPGTSASSANEVRSSALKQSN